MIRKFLLCLTMVFLTAGTVQAETKAGVVVGTFTQGELAEWKERSFKGHTNYQLIGKAAPLTLRATCQNTASALYRKMSVDLTKTPVLRWSWRVDGVHAGLNETTKAGDDYTARVYVIYAPNSLFPWKTKAINYVWSNNQPVGTSWPNAFTDHAVMIALRSGAPAHPAQWLHETRNVREDFKKLFGIDITNIDGVSVMTDCDNAGFPSAGYYRGIAFSTDKEQ